MKREGIASLGNIDGNPLVLTNSLVILMQPQPKLANIDPYGTVFGGMKVSRFVENGLPNCLFGQSCPIIRESALSEVTEQNRQTSGLLECLALCDALYQLEPIIICTAPKAV